MTNQLETAKEWISDLNKIIDITDNECTKQKRDVLEWLVESVDDLELVISKWSYQYEELANRTKDVDKQNQRLKQALEFYADEKTYERAETGELIFVYRPIEVDRGEKARQALEREG